MALNAQENFIHNGGRLWRSYDERFRSSDRLDRTDARTAELRALANFFPDGAKGVRQWQGIFEGVDDPEMLSGRMNLTSLERLSRDSTLTQQFRSPQHKTIFLSHRYGDTFQAEQLARDIEGRTPLRVWLDVWDPMLQALPHLTLSQDQRAQLIAHTIEIGLLNSDAVLALYTSNSSGSLWIPYEYGRIKSRKIYAQEAAAATQVPETKLPEYMVLGHYFEYSPSVTYTAADLGGYRGLKTWLDHI